MSSKCCIIIMTGTCTALSLLYFLRNTTSSLPYGDSNCQKLINIYPVRTSLLWNFTLFHALVQHPLCADSTNRCVNSTQTYGCSQYSQEEKIPACILSLPFFFSLLITSVFVNSITYTFLHAVLHRSPGFLHH